MKNILVGIDFSPASLNAFRYAASLGARYGSCLRLIHAYRPTLLEPHLDFGMQSALLAQQEALALRHFEELKETLAQEHRDRLKFEFEIALGAPNEVMLDSAKALNPDLMVVGAKGGRVWLKKLLGSTTQALIQQAEHPLLVVPELARYRGFEHIAYATDYQGDDIRIIDEVLYFAKQNRARLSCVHVRNQQASWEETYQQELLKRAYYYDLTHENIHFDVISDRDVVEGLAHYNRWEQVDLMVMMTHHRSRIGQLFHQSHCKTLSLNTEIPLWIYPQEKAVEVHL